MAKAHTKRDVDGSELTRDTIYNILGNQRRRHTLHYLAQQEDTVDLRRLSEQVAAWEHDVPVTDVTWEQRKNVYTALQQVHLPRMDETGIVDFDHDEGEITRHEDVEDLRVYLDFVPENDIAWNKYYLGLTVVSGFALAFGEIGLVPFGMIPLVGWASFVIVLFGVSAVAHTYHNRKMRLGGDGSPPGHEYERGANR